MKLNLGCGLQKKKGYIGLDIYNYGQEYILDFEKDDLPFKDNSVDEIYCHHTLEHLWNVRHILNECWRVLKPKGIFKIYVPYGLWSGASKPVHHQMITESWFVFLSRPKTKYYGYKRWRILKLICKKKREIFCKMIPFKNEKNLWGKEK